MLVTTLMDPSSAVRDRQNTEVRLASGSFSSELQPEGRLPTICMAQQEPCNEKASPDTRS